MTEYNPLSLKDQYDLAMDALFELNIESVDIQDPPDYFEIEESIGPMTQNWLDLRRENGIPDRLLIVPKLGELSLTELLYRGGVDIEHNTTWLNHTRGKYIWQHLSPEHHNGGSESPSWRVGVLLQDIKKGDGSLLNIYNEPGILYTHMTAARQHRILKKEARIYRGIGINVQPITASDYVVAKYGGIVDLDKVHNIESMDVPASIHELRKGERTRTIQREHKTVTRFVQYPRANIGNAPHCYDSSNMVGDEYVEPSWSMSRRVYIGVRRVAPIAIENSY